VSQTTRKYAGKVRYGRGFTLQEIKAAKLTPAFARTVGISVDHRRTSTSEEQMQMNVARLNSYKTKLVLFPRRDNKPKKGLINDSTAEQVKSAQAAKQVTGRVMPIAKKAQAVEFAAIEKKDQDRKVYHELRTIRTLAHYNGRRQKKADDEKKAKE
jgi:large subunit ribosomal protein L13e